MRNARTLRWTPGRLTWGLRPPPRAGAAPDLRSPLARRLNDEEVEMHTDDRIVHDTGDDAPVVREVEAAAEVEETDAEKIKADGLDEEDAEPR